MDIAFKSAIELVADIAAGKISSRELTQHYIDRIERYDSRVNAVVVRDFDGALAAADAADAALARGETLGPLHGLPMTVKEAYDVTGMPTTWGIPLFENNIATADAAYVCRLKEAGAHLLGKTNVPLNLGDFQSYNAIYGQTGNPWDLERTPGGSSGGSSAALAAGLTGLEAGSDIGGSIRNPAHFCGVYGHKPTWGVVPPQGHNLPGDKKPADIAVVGPMARSAADLALSMQLVAGADVDHAGGWQLNLPAPRKTRLADFKIAVWPSHELAPVAAEVAARVETVAANLRALGAQVDMDARPEIDFRQSLDVYVALLQGVISEGLPDDSRQEIAQMVASLPEGDTSLAAGMLRGAIQPHSAWMASHNQRFYLREQWRAFFADYDILICPQTATPAFPHDHSEPAMARTIQVDNVEQSYWQQLFWAGTITVAHLPSTVFPTGPSGDGLPIGLQAVGGEFSDYTTIEFARLMEEEFGGFTPPPDFS